MKRFLCTLAFAIVGTFFIVPYIDADSSAAQCADYKTIRVSVIVLKTKPEADNIKARLDKGENFYALAKKYSIVETSTKGGDCGYLTKAAIDKDYPEFSSLASTAAVGTISAPTKTRDGWTVAKLVARTY